MVQDTLGSGPGTPIRRPRPSMGPMGDLDGRNAIPLELRKTFDDFKRKHVRQNKEIIMDNARCKLAMRTLNEELLALRSELMAVRRTNGELTRELRRARTGVPLVDEGTRQALDYVLAAMPALQILRDNMSGTVNKRRGVKAGASPTKPDPKGVALAPRPAAKFVAPAARGGVSSLRGIVEGSEDIEDRPSTMFKAVENLEVEEEGIICVGAGSAPLAGPLPRLAAGLGASDSPSPKPSKASVGVIRADPASPSPKREKRSSPRKPKVSRKRRESGLIRADAASQSTPPRSSSPVPVAAASPGSSPLGAIAVASSSSPTPAARRSPRKSPKKQASTAAPLATGKPAPVVEPADEPDAFTVQPVLSEETDEDGGRGRRSRKSVNYKEPSLTRKMRKPDGMSVEEVIRLGGRQSLSAPSPMYDILSPTPTPAKSSTPTTGASGEVASDEPGPSQPLPRVMSMRQPGSTALGVRRKSVLPKAHSAPASSGPSSGHDDDAYDSDDDDLPAVDTLIPMVIAERPAPVTSSTAKPATAPPVKAAAKLAVAKCPAPSTQRPAPPPPSSAQRNVLKDISSVNARPGVPAGAARTLPKPRVIKVLRKDLEDSQPRGRVVSI